MNIGIDCSRAFGGDRTGTENYSYYVIKQLLRLPEVKTHKIVLFIRANAIIPEWVRLSNAEVVTIKQRYLWTQWGLAKATWNKKLDVLWVPAHTLPVLRKPGLKTVVTIHGLEYKWLPEYKNLLQRWYLPLSTYYAAHSADSLIAVSKFTKQQLVEEAGINPEKVAVIYEGVDTKDVLAKEGEWQKISKKYQIEHQKYLLFVGTLQPRKNLPSLIAAYAEVKQKFPDIKLVVAGGKGWITEEIFKAPEKCGVEDSVIFTGRVSDTALATLYENALIYVQPSWQEGFGLPVLEAMKRKVPVVVSEGGALSEVVGDAGAVVKLNNFINNLVKELTILISESSKRRTLINSGSKRVRYFTWEKAANETWKMLVNIH